MRIATSVNVSDVKTRRGRSAQGQNMSKCSLLHSAQINTGNTTNASTRKCGKITRHLKTRLNFIQVTKPNPSTHTLLSHFYAPASAQFTISQSIVEDVICELYWRDDEEADEAADDVPFSETKRRVVSSFGDLVEDKDTDEGDHYVIVIKNVKLWRLVVRLLAVLPSFNAVMDSITAVRAETHSSIYQGLSTEKVGSYARYCCAIGLQEISTMMNNSWAFAIALDGSNHMEMHFLDVRIQIFSDERLVHKHLMAMPLYSAKGASAMFHKITLVLDALYDKWRSTLIGVSTDGEPVMTGRLGGIATLFEKEVKFQNFFRIWCPLHQVEIVLAKAYTEFGVVEAADEDNGEMREPGFVKTLKELISFLRRKTKFKEDLGSQPQMLSFTRWASMSATTQWFADNFITVNAFLNDNGKDPGPSWWLRLFVANDFSTLCLLFQNQMQSKDISICAQQEILTRMHESAEKRLGVVDDITAEEKGGNVISNLGLHAQKLLQRLSDSEIGALYRDVYTLYSNFIKGARKVQAERDGIHQSSVQCRLPPVFPHQLIQIQHADFCKIIKLQKPRLLHSFDEQTIDKMAQEHKRLCNAVLAIPTLETEIRSTFSKNCPPPSNGRDASMVSFEGFAGCWEVVGPDYSLLKTFCGGLATVLANTSRVEGDFSVLKYLYNKYRTKMMFLSIEGHMHAKQLSDKM